MNMWVPSPEMFQFGLLLLQQKPNDRDHKVRVAVGNGLRGDVWREFIKRFGDIHIYEFYASTEGNIGFVNYTRKIGAIGRANYLQRVSTLKNESIYSQFSEYRDFLKAMSRWCYYQNFIKHQSCGPFISPREVLFCLYIKDLRKIGCCNLKILISVKNSPLGLCHLQFR